MVGNQTSKSDPSKNFHGSTKPYFSFPLMMGSTSILGSMSGWKLIVGPMQVQLNPQYFFCRNCMELLRCLFCMNLKWWRTWPWCKMMSCSDMQTNKKLLLLIEKIYWTHIKKWTIVEIEFKKFLRCPEHLIFSCINS